MRTPLRTRLTLAFAAGMALVLALLGVFLYLRLSTELLASIDMGLRSRADVVDAGLARSDADLAAGPEQLIDPDEAFAQVVNASTGAIVISSQGMTGITLLPPSEVATITGPTFVSRRVQGLDDPARLLAVPSGSGSGRVVIVVGATLSDRAEALRRLVLALAVGGPIALCLMSLAGWWLAGAALKPVERMRTEAEVISEWEPERRLPVPPTRDELASLATTLNAMLDRLRAALEREHRFVDQASHEIRTPLALLKGELELAISRPRDPDELRAALLRARSDAEHLVRLSDDLLVLARARDGHLPVHRVETPLREVLDETCEAFRGPAGDARVDLRIDAPDVPVRIDPVRLRQAIGNLVDNALQHASDRSRIVVTGEPFRDRVLISVTDDGAGFPPDLLPRIFEAFTEGPNGDGRGTGLGLAIVKAVAEAHGGSATAENVPEGGARVTITLGT